MADRPSTRRSTFIKWGTSEEMLRVGESVLVGVPSRRLTDLTAHDLTHAVFFGMITLRSGWEWELPISGRGFVWEELLEGYNNAPHSLMGGFARALEWLNEGQISLEGLVRSLSPGDPVTLYDDIASRRIAEPFLVLDWTN